METPKWHLFIQMLYYCFARLQPVAASSVLFLSCPRSEGWPHHGRTFSVYLYPLSFWLTLPQDVLSTSWCCLSRPCVVFLACIHLASGIVPCIISFSRKFPCFLMVWPEYASFLALTVSNSSLFTPAFLKTQSFASRYNRTVEGHILHTGATVHLWRATVHP